MASVPANLSVERVGWSAAAWIAARDGLRATFNHPEAEAEFRAGVESGHLALWRVGSSWAITGMNADRLMVYAYQGEDARGFVANVCATCRAAGIPSFDFYTRRKGLPRLLRAFAPRPLGDGFWRIDVAR